MQKDGFSSGFQMFSAFAVSARIAGFCYSGFPFFPEQGLRHQNGRVRHKHSGGRHRTGCCCLPDMTE
jgi:hypothetical protein